jgi:hypothetical protein
LTSEGHTKLHRVSFSTNVLDHIGSRHLGKPYQVLRLDYRLGKRMENGSTSETGAYAICSGRTGQILRVTLHYTMAWSFLADGDDRFVAEIELQPHRKSS